VFTAQYVLPTQCIYVFCVDLRTSSDYFSVQRETERKRKEGGVANGASYTQALWGGGRQSITLLEGSQASPARPSDNSSLR
jgi:hypothetical protein